jgi:outer membrane lipoprotein-sorting protein
LVDRLRGQFFRNAKSETLPKTALWKRGLTVSLPLAAVVVVAAGVSALLISRDSAADVSFAEVQAKVRETHTVNCKVTRVTVPTPKAGERSTRLLIRGPDLVRDEGPDGGYTITDYSLHKSISVDRANKSARITEGINLPTLNFYAMFRSIAADPTKTLPPREINGKKAVGFMVRPPILEGRSQQPSDPDTQVAVWVDPQSRLPLRIEITSKEPGGVTVTEAMSDIVFDGPIDGALFDMAPPKGYRVESFGVAELQPEMAPRDAGELVITPGLGIGPVRFGMKTTEVTKLLGPPDKILNPVKGMDVLEYYSRGFGITARDGRGVLMITCYSGNFLAVKTRDFAGRTDKGLRMGSRRAAIEKEYGPPSSVVIRDAFGKPAAKPAPKNGHVDLSYEALGISFSLRDDSLESIMMRAPRQRR